jgi:MFS family permease
MTAVLDDVTHAPIDVEPAATTPTDSWHDFTHTWSAHSVSSFGDHFTMVALPLATYLRTHSAFTVGAVAAMEAVAVLVLGLVAGALSDRWRRRPVLVLTDYARAVVVGLLAVGVVSDSYPVALLFGAALVLGLLRVVHDASEAAVVPILVDGPRLLRANSRLQASDSAAIAAGPAIAGGLIAIGGPALAFAGDALSFAASGTVMRSVRRLDVHDPQPAREASRPRLRSQISEGCRALWADSDMMRAVVLLAVMNVVVTAAEAQFIPYAKQILGIGAVGIGAYMALGGLVAVATSVVVGRRSQMRGDMMLLGVIVFAVGFIVAGVWPSFLSAGVAFFGAGFGSALAGAHFYALRHARFPVSMQGRVSTVSRTALTSLLPAAYLLGGWFSRHQGPDALFVAVGCIGLGACLWGVCTSLRRLRIG